MFSYGGGAAASMFAVKVTKELGQMTAAVECTEISHNSFLMCRQATLSSRLSPGGFFYFVNITPNKVHCSTKRRYFLPQFSTICQK
jgi:hypothetical protein